MDKKETHNRAVQMRRKNMRSDIKSLWISLAVFTTLILSTNNTSAQNTRQTDFANPKNDTTLVSGNPAASLGLYNDTRIACQNLISNETSKQRVIEQISKEKTEELQKQIIQNIDNLQTEIKNAAQRGQKASFIAKIFKKVSPVALSGKSNYCTAGAMSVYEDITDPILKEIAQNTLASTKATPKDLHLFSHPNISCPAFCSYYKENFGDNYIDRKSPEFQNALNKLEAGDILMVKSSHNTSSGLHCVTFEKYESGNICVKGFNTESNYTINKSRIVSITKIPNQIRENIQSALEKDQELLLTLMAQNPSITSRAYQLNLQRTPGMVKTAFVIDSKGRESITASFARIRRNLTKTM